MFKGPGLLIMLVVFAMTVASLTGCEGVTLGIEGSPFPVGSERRAVFDAGLVGIWRSAPMDEDQPTELVINSNDGRTYQISMREGSDRAALVMTGFVVDLNGMRVLNAELVNQAEIRASGYLSFRYQLEAPDRLTLFTIEGDGWADRSVNSADELFEYLLAHGHESALYGEAVHFRRVALW
jgi:hypothetical protein